MCGPCCIILVTTDTSAAAKFGTIYIMDLIMLRKRDKEEEKEKMYQNTDDTTEYKQKPHLNKNESTWLKP